MPCLIKYGNTIPDAWNNLLDSNVYTAKKNPRQQQQKTLFISKYLTSEKISQDWVIPLWITGVELISELDEHLLQSVN